MVQWQTFIWLKVPYTAWAGKENTPVNSTDTYNFLDGLEQRYGVDWYGDRGARERQLFSKLNSIGIMKKHYSIKQQMKWWDTNMLMFNKEYRQQLIY